MSQHLGALVAEVERECAVRREQIVLGGFSMGGHMALQAVYGKAGGRVGAAFALSSFLSTKSVVLEETNNKDTVLFLSWGDSDDLVEPGWVQNTKHSLEERGVRTK